jgi:hypothetical protein
MNSIKQDCERAVTRYLVSIEPAVIAQGAAYRRKGLDGQGHESGM